MKNDSFFVLRTPRLSLKLLEAFSEQRTNTIKILSDWMEVPGVKEALYIASPSVFSRLDNWMENPTHDEKFNRTLIKYMIRMCSRPTPFGLFAGVSLGTISNSTRLLVGDYLDDKRKTRFDIVFLSQFLTLLNSQESTSNTIEYKLNSSLYRVANACRYLESQVTKYGLNYHLSEIEIDEAFKQILLISEKAKTKKLWIKELCEKLGTTETSEVEAYISELIDQDILQPDLSIPIIGESPDKGFLKRLQNLPTDYKIDLYSHCVDKLEQLDKSKINEISSYKYIIKTIEPLNLDIKESNLFQTDCYRKMDECSLDVDEAKKLVSKIQSIASFNSLTKSPYLEHFKRQFYSRYEGRFVSLLQVMDDESGISINANSGYDSSLLEDLPVLHQLPNDKSSKKLTVLQAHINSLLRDPKNQKAKNLQLSLSDLNRKFKNKIDFSSYAYSCYAMFNALKNEQGSLVYSINHYGGPSAANLLGRFCHLDDQLLASVKKHILKEEQHSENVLFAEIVHHPSGRPGNIIARPQLRNYEIMFMASSDSSEESKIFLDDIYVYVEFNTVKLWSRSKNKRIIPRMSNAHNFMSSSLNIYKFLCLLQTQENAPNLNLTDNIDSAYTPRIMIDNLILSPRRWRISRELFVTASKDKQFKKELLQTYQLDHEVCYAAGDNVLSLNLLNDDMFNILIDESKHHQVITLEENIYSDFESAVQSHSGENYCNEFILPIINDQSKPLESRSSTNIASFETTNRRFGPGSKWLSLKLYGGNAAIENILIDKLRTLIEQYNGLYEKWFFIRYSDPDWHIRLRFYGDPGKIYGQLLPKLNIEFQQLLDSHVLWRVELMTYERELERYGGIFVIDEVEKLFQLDSELVIKVISKSKELDDDIVRMRVAILFSYSIMELFGFGNKDMFDLVKSMRISFGEEFNESKFLRTQLGKKYKTVSKQLRLDFDSWKLHKTDDLYDLVKNWHLSAAPIVKFLKSSPLECSYKDLVSSIIHMHCNRVFMANGRQHELVMYDFLRKLLLSNNLDVVNNLIKN